MAESALLGITVSNTGAETGPSSGKLQAWRFTAKNTGTVKSLKLQAAPKAGTMTSCVFGIAADNSGQPSLATFEEHTFSGAQPKGEAMTVSGFGFNVVSGQKYWLFVIPLGGGMKIVGGSEGAGTGNKAPTTVEKLSQVTEWQTLASGLTAGPLPMEAIGVITIEKAAGTGGGRPKLEDSSIRDEEPHTQGGGEPKLEKGGVPDAKATGAGRPIATIGSDRTVEDAHAIGGGLPGITLPLYGANQVFSYDHKGPFPNAQNTVSCLKGASPGEITAILLHESGGHDEPTEAALLAGTDGLPRSGESTSPRTEAVKELQAWKFAEETNEVKGWAVFVPTYRTLKQQNLSCLEDLESLIAWVKRHCAAWNGDPNKVVIIGASFGSTIGSYLACLLNERYGAGYIKGVAALSGPEDIPGRVEQAIGGENEAVLEKIANYLSTESAITGYTMTPTGAVTKNHLKEPGWLREPAQKKILELAEKLSIVYNLKPSMPWFFYVVSKEDATPQGQMKEVEEAATAFGELGKVVTNSAVPKGHGWEYWSEVKVEVWAFLTLAVNPPIIASTLATGGGRSRIQRPVPDADASGGGRSQASLSSTRTLELQARGGGRSFAQIGVLAAMSGGGNPSVQVGSKRVVNAVHVAGGGHAEIAYEPRASGGGRAAVSTGSTRDEEIDVSGGGHADIPDEAHAHGGGHAGVSLGSVREEEADASGGGRPAVTPSSVREEGEPHARGGGRSGIGLSSLRSEQVDVSGGGRPSATTGRSYEVVGVSGGGSARTEILRPVVARRVDITVAIGQTLDFWVPLFVDEEETEPYDLTGATVEVYLEPYDLGENPPLHLTSGGGLHIPEGPGGVFRITYPIEPDEFDVGLGRWYTKLTDITGRVSYPRSGRFTVGRP